jgi:hypothetical protein
MLSLTSIRAINPWCRAKQALVRSLGQWALRYDGTRKGACTDVQIGSANMDLCSLRLNFENSADNLMFLAIKLGLLSTKNKGNCAPMFLIPLNDCKDSCQENS